MQIKLTNDAGDKFRVFWQPPRDIEAVPAVSEGWRALWVRSIAPALLARMTVWTSLGAGSVTLCAAPAGSIEGLSRGPPAMLSPSCCGWSLVPMSLRPPGSLSPWTSR